MNTHLRYLKLSIVAVAWCCVLLATTYRSHAPVVFDRYSVGYAGLLGLLITVALTLSLAKLVRYQSLYQARAGIVLSGVSLLVSLGVLELGIRLFDPLGISYYEVSGEYQRDKLADDQLVFRHRPSWEKQYGQVLVTYNELGLRDRPVLPKADGEYRILALGDSVTFGSGVAQDQIFTVRLEQLLHDRLQRLVRVINSGVGGYNTVQEVTYFKRDGIKLQPDLVILTYIQNDIEEVRRPFDPWAASSIWGKSPPDMLLTMLGKLWVFRFVHHTYHYAWPVKNKKEKQVDSSLQESVGWRQSMVSLEELVGLCRDQKIPLMVFYKRSPGEYSALFEAVVHHTHGIPVRDMGQWYKDVDESVLVNSKIDGHPNAMGHQLIAEHMADDIMNYLSQH